MRDKLIENLAYAWRRAENHYLKTEDDSEKLDTLIYQERLNLNDEEYNKLQDMLKSMGV